MLALDNRCERLKWPVSVEADEAISSAGMEGVLVVSIRDPARSELLEAYPSPVRLSSSCGT